MPVNKYREQQKRKRDINWAKIMQHDAFWQDKRKNRCCPVISEQDIKNLYKVQNHRCYYCSELMNNTRGFRHPKDPSLERLDNSQGHTKENCVIL